MILSVMFVKQKYYYYYYYYYKSIQGGPKNWHTLLYVLTSYDLTSSIIDRFSNLFQYLNQEYICNNSVTKNPTIYQVRRFTIL